MTGAQRVINQGFILGQVPAEGFREQQVVGNRAELKLIGVENKAQWSPFDLQGVRVCAADGNDRLFAVDEELVPQLQSCFQRAKGHQLREKRVQDSLGKVCGARLEFAHLVPQFNTGIAANLPVFPVKRCLAKGGQGVFNRVGDESESAGSGSLINQLLRV